MSTRVPRLITRIPVLRRLSHRPLIASALGLGMAVVVGFGAGMAYAYFTGHGSGAGNAKVAAGDQPITIGTASVSGATQLYPGGTGDLVATVTNPNSAPVTITAMTISSSGCTTPALSLKRSFTIPANTSNAVMHFAGVLSMGTGASNDCQGKTLTLSLSNVTAQQ